MAPRHQPSAFILFFHGVVERVTDPLLQRNFLRIDEFKEKIAFLRRFPTLSLEDLPEGLARKSPKGPLVCITVDDGHRSSLTMAQILHQAGMPWSLFLSTGCLGPSRTLWPMEFSLLILYGESSFVDLLDKRWSLESREDRVATFRSTRSRLKALPADRRRREFNRLRAQFPPGELDRLLSLWPCAQTLSWDEVASLSLSGVSIGSHGVHHEVHHRNQLYEVRQNEIAASKSEIEERLGVECSCFSFPNGDLTADSVRELAAWGYTMGVTTLPGSTTLASDFLKLPRVSQNEISGCLH